MTDWWSHINKDSIVFENDTGSMTVARTPELALVYWLSAQMPRTPIENPEPFKVYVSDQRLPGENDPILIPSVIGAIERRWNQSLEPPETDIALFILKWLRKHGDIAKLMIYGETI